MSCKASQPDLVSTQALHHPSISHHEAHGQGVDDSGLGDGVLDNWIIIVGQLVLPVEDIASLVNFYFVCHPYECLNG
jgi:hypothetical protein